jgi:hypothetical protein
MQLNPKDAVVLFIRRSDSEPTNYMLGIRRAETELDGNHDLRIVQVQESVSEVGKFDTLEEAIHTGARRLDQLVGKAAASGS